MDRGLYDFSIRNDRDLSSQVAESDLLLQPVPPVLPPQLVYQGGIDAPP
jgi:hypothetical protein